MNFDKATDRPMRQRILGILAEIDEIVVSRHVREFAVARTYSRKDGRDHRSFTADASPYQSDPRVLFRIEFEVPDDVTPSTQDLVADLVDIETVGIRAARKAKLAAARDKLVQAQAEVDRLQKELTP